ncbi:MAG: hypothetical protein K9L76_02055, partial [Candidatus Omnitrophica bacterium]|nr:hypothetical protein [Candidatus Omnitrophota bacterium]
MTAQYDDEINLRDYINVLIKRKVTIFVAFFICVAAVAFYSFTAPEIYRVEETIRIGQVDGSLISKAEAIRLIRSKNTLQPVVEALDKDLSLSGLKKSLKIEEVKGTDFLSISINHKNPQRAIEILKNTADNFIKYGNSLYAKKIKLLEERMEALEIQKQSIKKEINSLQGVIKDKVTPDYPLIQNTLTSYEAIYSQLDDKIYALKVKLTNAKKFELFEPPLEPKSPISPKKKQNIAIAGILGLMLGVFIAFFREFWVNSAGEEE